VAIEIANTKQKCLFQLVIISTQSVQNCSFCHLLVKEFNTSKVTHTLVVQPDFPQQSIRRRMHSHTVCPAIQLTCRLRERTLTFLTKVALTQIMQMQYNALYERHVATHRDGGCLMYASEDTSHGGGLREARLGL
jgi:hypothetical protein